MKPKALKLVESVLSSLNHDFCPGLNRYVYWMKQPIGWVVGGAVASLLVGIFIGPQGFVLMGSFLVLLFLGAAWPWLSMKGLSCRISLVDSRTEENEATQIVLEVTNRWPLPAFGLMVSGQFLQNIADTDDVIAVALRRVPALSVSRFDWPIEPKRRGILPNEQPVLSTGFPFNLSTFEKEIEVSGKTIVWPACTSLDGVPEFGGSQFNIDGVSSTRSGKDGETIGAREYRHGDSIKNIHWSRTAQFNRMIVRERQSFTQTPISIVVDLVPDHHHGTCNQSTYECAIRIAGTVAKQLHQHQSRVDLICVGVPTGTPSRTSNRNGLSPLMDFLALLPTHDLSAASKPRVDRQFSTDRNQFTILIQTKSFDLNPQSDKRVLRINIDSTEFASSPNPRHDLPLGNEITSPLFAPQQLSQCWAGAVHAQH